MTEPCASDPIFRANDLARPGVAARLLWGGPMVLFVAGCFVDAPWRPIAWIVALGVAGGACLENARRCGRRHCFFTGPFYLLMAVLTAVYWIGWLPVTWVTWGAIAATVGAGSLLLQWLPERFWGRYARYTTVGGV